VDREPVATAFPDLKYVIDESIAEGDKLACRVTLSGTHTGEFRHPAIGVVAPTGPSFSVDLARSYRLVDGKIAEHSATRNDLALLQQLGVIAGPPAL
jgi:predicted ester cyclase